MKQLFLLAVLTLFSFNLRAQTPSNVADEVVWVVGDEAILRSDVEKQRLMGERIQGNPYCVIPENLAIQKLFLHQAILDSITVSDAEVNQNVEARLNQWVLTAGSREKLEEYRNMTYSQLREEMFNQIKEMYIVSMVRRELTKNVRVTPAEVRRFFRDVPEDSLPLIPTKVEVQIIQFHPVIPQEEIDRVKSELREYSERINSGQTSFATLARLYSEDPGSARQGGELDFAGRGVFDPAFANVAFSLTNTNRVSKIVQTEYGFHIMQLIERRGDRVKVRHILRRPVVDRAQIDDALTRLDSLARDIRADSLSFETAALYLSDDKDTRNNHGVMFNVVEDDEGEMIRTSRFEMRHLPAEVARVVERLEVGEVSAPFTMIDKNGREVCAIVKLKARTNQHRATITEDFQTLRSIVLQHKQGELIDNWIRDKQRSTYVRIHPDWRNCDFQYPGWVLD